MTENDGHLQTNTYVWSQSNDQITISFLVPESVKAKDMDIVIEKEYLKAGIKGKEPVFQAKLYQEINHFESLWQLEKNSISPFSSLTASPSLSIASSFAFMSSPAHSPTSSMILPYVVDAGISEMSDLLAQTTTSSAISESDGYSQPTSPRLIDTPPAFATPPHLKKPKYRILTIHLEKLNTMVEWPLLISGPHNKTNAMDVTSSYLLGQWYEVRMGDFIKALELFLSAAERGHTQSMLKVAAIYELNQDMVSANTKIPDTDHKKAFEWYKRAADCEVKEPGTDISSGPDPLACFVIGTSYSSSVPEANVPKDYQSALYYYNRCMTITAPHIDADFSLLDQDHIPKHKLRSHPPHTRDERYFCSSAFQTGLIYLYGSNPEGEQKVRSITNVDVDTDLAIRYWKEAALLGHAQACYNIGILYANGMGIEKDLWIAGKWFGRALKLDTTGNLVVPEGVTVIDWDATKDQEKQTKKKLSPSNTTSLHSSIEKKKKRRKVKRESDKVEDSNADVVGAFVMLGTIIAVTGTAWYFYRTAKNNN